LFGDGLYPEVQTFQCARSQQREVGRLAEHHVVIGSFAGDIDNCAARPALENGPVSLAEVPLIVPLDPQGLEDLGRNPGQFRAGVDKHRPERSSLARTDGILDVDVNSKGSHVAWHNYS